MCFFFKKKKLDNEQVVTTIANALTELDMPGIPELKNRTEENFIIKKSNGDAVGAQLMATEEDLTLQLGFYYWDFNKTLHRYVTFKDVKLNDNKMKTLRNKYPQLEFAHGADGLSADKKREKGELTTKGTPVKTLESIFKAVKDGAEEINYLCVYSTVKTLVDEQKENK